ncbi:MAG: 2-keto-3-deoxy-L-rhamnonate aldolase [Methylobacteriaceae bacterium]|jgi:2-dehydro-3-deoxy-L-rhamnonate aldolase|nr:2-keto-3-deoxy-L-rhamnonate aldolase [Methylobacteriaceae bacterium]
MTPYSQHNPFKKAIAEGKVQYGMWLDSTSAAVAEVAATAGYDWLVIDAEHGPNTVQTMFAQLQAVAPYYPASHPIIRPLEASKALIKQALDIGAQTLLLPMIDTPEQAAQVVSYVRYPPIGERGVAPAIARAARWSRVKDYMAHVEENLCVLLQVETRAGLENLDAITRTPGVDGIFIGPADLSASLGHPDDVAHPEMLAVYEKTFKRIRELGKAAGFFGGEPALTNKVIEWGANFVAIGADISLLMKALDERLALFRK